MSTTPWNPTRCQTALSQAKSKEDARALFRRVYAYTKDAVSHQEYLDEHGTKKKLHLALVDSPLIFDDSHPAPELQTGDNESTIIEIRFEDCLYAAKRILDEEGVKPLVLNMASFKTPGGGVEHGAGAQEEDLFRRSNYMESLYPLRDKAYPLHMREGAIYSGNVTVFREARDKGYAFMDKPFQVDFVAVAAEKMEQRRPFSPQQKELYYHKVRVLLRVAHNTGHTHLVLSALGCGAFKNPPAEASKIFAAVLEEPEFKGKFKHIVFAILGFGSFVPFKHTFEGRTNYLGTHKMKRITATHSEQTTLYLNPAKNIAYTEQEPGCKPISVYANGDGKCSDHCCVALQFFYSPQAQKYGVFIIYKPIYMGYSEFYAPEGFSIDEIASLEDYSGDSGSFYSFKKNGKWNLLHVLDKDLDTPNPLLRHVAQNYGCYDIFARSKPNLYHYAKICDYVYDSPEEALNDYLSTYAPSLEYEGIPLLPDPNLI